jgi:probable HAF family extracellular repeat protein
MQIKKSEKGTLTMKKLLLIFCVTACLCCAGCKGSVYVFSYIELLPPDWQEAAATFINKDGTVVGYGYDATDTDKGFIYSNGQYTYLLPPGWFSARAYAINDSGAVVGDGSDNNNTDKGFIYSSGQYTELLPPGWLSATAYFISNNGAVVGWGKDDAGIEKGFIYRNGQYTEVMPPGWVDSAAFGINDSGVVVGVGYNGVENRGFIYSDGQYTGLLPPQWSHAEANAINDSGVIVGDGLAPQGICLAGKIGKNCIVDDQCDSSPGASNGLCYNYETYTGFIYTNGQYTELLPAGWSLAYVYAINNKGVVAGWGTDTAHKICVDGKTGNNCLNDSQCDSFPGAGDGYCETYEQDKGFIYSRGVYTELLPPEWAYAAAYAINDSGIAVGIGEDENGIMKGFIATPK